MRAVLKNHTVVSGIYYCVLSVSGHDWPGRGGFSGWEHNAMHRQATVAWRQDQPVSEACLVDNSHYTWRRPLELKYCFSSPTLVATIEEK